MTRAQNTILQIVKEHPHRSAEHIYMVIKKAMPNVALGTVYRNLGKFAESKVIRRISRGESPDLFDPTITPHDHVICKVCGEAEDVDLHGLEEHINASTEKNIESFEILLYHTCTKCQ